MINKFPKTIGFIGASNIAEKHTKILSRVSPSSEFIVLSNHIFESQPWGHKVKFTDEIDLFMKAQPDLVVITTPASSHAIHLEEIVSQAKQILIEKPIAASLADALKIQKITSSAKCHVVLGYNLRFMQSLAAVTSALAERKIGKPLHLCMNVGQDLSAWRPKRAVETTVSAKREAGGGVLRELSHEIDLLRLLFGQISHVNLITGRQKYTTFDVEDTAMINVLFSEPQTVLGSLNMDFTRRDPTRKLELIGEDGTLKWDLLKGTVIFADELGKTKLAEYKNDIKTTYTRMWQAFLAGNFSQFCTVENGVEILRLIELAERSGVRAYGKVK